MSFLTGDIVYFCRWTDALAQLSGPDELKYRHALNQLYRVVRILDDGKIVGRRREYATGDFVDILLEPGSVDFVGRDGCDAQLREEHLVSARLYLRLALHRAKPEDVFKAFSAFDQFISIASLTPYERDLVDAEMYYGIVFELVCAHASWDEILAAYGRAEPYRPRVDLEATVALALHHRALREGRHVGAVLAKVTRAIQRLEQLHSSHPLRRFDLPKNLNDAADALGALGKE